MAKTAETHRYRVHAHDRDAHHARMVEETSFEAAAVAYIEDLHDLGSEPEVRVIVRDEDSGHEHCFRVDLQSGETAACG
jgi:hypothetical protein